MIQIYEDVTLEKYKTLIGMTCEMHNGGKTPVEIALETKQPLEKVLECIKMCEQLCKNLDLIKKYNERRA